ncbi:hypothetical protein LSH36_907g00018 [Paralvinella palmiformis]|uniref:Rabenosyn-5 n=1 Tax=Paralvinella palmiformis TaxID=53620 RepID=A0AAD9IYT0_9ANNE|nr:hypothetical protein LSH36_907g00018 [Paralvinella palmiformis]
MSDVAVREGFLCPICVQDLGSIAELQKHFENSHSGEDKDVINQLKGLFGKAKRKLMKKDKESDDVFSAFSGENSDAVSSATNTGGIDPTMWEPQELGGTRSHTDYFKSVRDVRIDRFVVETNKLLIRLDKLLSPDAPTDPNKRKVYEKSVVPWAPDSDVNLCTACGKSFTITRRRHHCRLCGGIICNRCSQFLPFSYAKKLTNPAFHYEGEGFRRSSSSTSLNSILSPEGEGHIRTCEPCRMLLERRDQQIEQRNSKPLIVQIYQKMKVYVEEADQVLPTFLDMAESLHAGETTYNIREAMIYRNKLAKLYENIDLLSKRIYTFGTNDAEPPSTTTLRLQKMIRLYASGYLQRNMMSLQALPSEEEVIKLQEHRRLEVQRRIDEERRLAAQKEGLRRDNEQRPNAVIYQKQKSPEKTPNGSTRTPEVFQKSQGWKPAEISAGNCDDPMIQQINIIKGYVKQARQAGKWDEVQMLEENLNELQREYWAQRGQHRELHGDKPECNQSVNAGNPFSNSDNNPFNERPLAGHPKGSSGGSAETSPARKSPSKGSLKMNSPSVMNPFAGGDDSKSGSTKSDRSSFLNDPTNPFSDNYREPTCQSSSNPFS